MPTAEEKTQAELMTASQFARARGSHISYINALISSGKLKAVKQDGQWRIPADALVQVKQRREAVGA